jgi:hypothetical protein
MAIAAFSVLGMPTSAFAQGDKWEVDIAPLYLWAATTSGTITLNGTKDIPVYLDFADAKSKLSGVFTFHGEARKGTWGVLGDILFMRLSSDVSYTTPILGAPIDGTLEFSQTTFNGKVTFEVKPGSRFHVAGGIRTMTMAPTAHFTGPVGGQLADIEVSKTKVAGVGGFYYRPKLGSKVVLLTQADIGGGSAFTWSAMGGVEFLIKPWMGLAAGYNALRIDTGTCPRAGRAGQRPEYAVTQYGPLFTDVSLGGK